jgi:hypothetical protein
MYSGQRCACDRPRACEHGRFNDDVTSVQPAPQWVAEMKGPRHLGSGGCLRCAAVTSRTGPGGHR